MISLTLNKETNFLPDEVRGVFWEFVRGDMAIESFEKWIYLNIDNVLMKALGDKSYHELASLNYNDEEELNVLVGALYELLAQFPEKCLCSTFYNNTVIYPFTDGIEKIALRNQMEFLKMVTKFEGFSGGHPVHQSQWYHMGELCCCTECKTQWLVIFEQCDSDYYLIRLSKEDASLVTQFPNWPNKDWPAHLRSWEDFLKIEFQKWSSRYVELQAVHNADNLLSSYCVSHMKISKEGKLMPRY